MRVMSAMSAIVRRPRIPLTLAVLAALIGPAGHPGQASIAATGTGAATAGAATAVPPRGAARARPATAHKARLTARTSPADMAKPDTAQAVMASARQAIASTTIPGTCSGTISPDTIYPCTTPSSTGTDTFTLTLPNATDLVLIRVLATGVSSANGTLPVTLTAPDGTAVTCAEPAQLYKCHTTQAGTYTLTVASQGSTSYTLAYTPLLSDASCMTVNLSFATPGTSGTLPIGDTGTCFSFSIPSGHVLDLQVASGSTPTLVAVYDSTGALACEPDASGHCTPTGTGPYHVLIFSPYGEKAGYHLQLHDLTDPAGCTTAVPETYGQVPASGTDKCRTLTVTTAGGYRVYADNSAFATAGTVYSQAGTPVCTSTLTVICTLAAGTYDFVVDDAYQESFAIVFVAAAESRGCVNTGDTDFASGPATGTFGGAGEVVCLTLPTASGQSDFIYDESPVLDHTLPTMTVVDATGAEQCGTASSGVSDFICAFTGTAPFRVLYTDPVAGAGYTLYVQRTNSTAGCAPWPASGFGGTWGATVHLSGPNDVKCLAIPAGQHTASEMIGESDATNAADGYVSVFDPNGQEPCAGHHGVSHGEAICYYQPGVTYMALVTTTAQGESTYDLVRRDVTASAHCSALPSTTVGGPSTTVTLTSELDAYCFRISAAAADKFWISLRANTAEATANNPLPPQGTLWGTDASGKGECVSYVCKLTGSTDYQILVIASYYDGTPITTHLDTWLVGTASGWVPQCQAHHFTAGTTWGPVNGTLTEKAAGYCAVVDVKPGQMFTIQGSDSASDAHPMLVNVYPSATWASGNSSSFLCSGWFPSPNVPLLYRCDAGGISTAITALLLLTPDAVPGPVTYGFWGTDCPLTNCSPIAPLVTSVSPAAQVAGSANRVVVAGSELTWDTPFALVGKSGQVAAGTPVAVNSAGTRLTVRIDTSHLAPGRYGVTVGDPGYTAGTASPGYLPGAYTVKAKPVPRIRFIPVTPARVLDTARGRGAPRRRVAGHGVVSLKVTGRDRVPASGVAAVAVELTAVNPARSGHLAAYPSGTGRRSGASLSFTARRTATSLAVVPVRHGRIALYNGSAGKLGLRADLVGYYAKGSRGLRFTPVASHRILDTRRGLGARKSQVAAHRAVTFTVAGAGGVPARGVTAVALDVTAIGPARAGHLTAYAAGTARRNVTSLSFTAHRATEGLVIAKVRNRKVTIYNASSGRLSLTADVAGYFTAGRGPGFHPVGPRLILNTRTGLSGTGRKIASHTVAVTRVAGAHGIPSKIRAVILSVTVSGAGRAGTLTVYPNGKRRPARPSLAFNPKHAESTLVIVPVVNGRVDFYNKSSAAIQLAATLEGYYTP